MIESNVALYQKINIIISVLISSRNEIYAKKLSDALSISTIPSEILGETRLVLEKLNKTELPKLLGIGNDIEESLKYLNKIL